MFTTVGSRIWLFQNLWRSILLIAMFLHQHVAAAKNNGNCPPSSCGEIHDITQIFIFPDQPAAAKNNGNCPPASCGNIHGIIYPFRLDTDPPNCGFSSFAGDRNFTLSCHNNSSLFWYLNNDSSGRFLVKGINYDNFTIHLVDPGVQQNNCSSLPISPISSSPSSASILYSFYYTISVITRLGETYLARPAALISCDRKQVDNPYYSYFVEITAPCKTKVSKEYSYVIVGGRYSDQPDVVRLVPEMESCSIDMITLLPNTNYDVTSYREIHTQFSAGFHLSWLPVSCHGNCSGRCILDHANRPTCQDSEDWPWYDIRAYIPYVGFIIYRAVVGAARIIGFDQNTFIPDPLNNIWVLLVLGSLTDVLALFGAIHALIFLFGSPCVFVFLILQWRRRHLSLYNTIEEFLQNQNNLMPIRYSYKDIKKMTSCFKEKLGEGGFGCVYKGKLRSGHFAAIKILSKSSKVTNGQDFMNEVATLGRIHHVNVVQLVGYCAEQSKRALVYDFMSNGSLDRYIFAKEGLVSLSWDKLFEISLGVARGIEYLHRGCDMQILHFDIKPHNILLDENFIPKISDFGLAKLYSTTKDTIASLTAARGTIGYMAPELFYKNIGRVSYKADVYSFGMLLLEIAGKRKSLNALVEKSSQIYFPSWVYDQVANGNDIEIGDNATEEETKIVKKMIIVGLWCIQMKPSDRPPMNKVVEMLEGDIENLEMPPKPSLSLEEMPNVAETSESSYVSDESSESISLIESAG